MPGNARAGGVRNPAYITTFVFDNDFAALKPGTRRERFEQEGLLVAEAEPGICRVVCFSPKHNLTIANMEPADLGPWSTPGWSSTPSSARIRSAMCRFSKTAVP